MKLYSYDKESLEYKKIPLKRIIFFIFGMFLLFLTFFYLFGKSRGWTMRDIEIDSLNNKICEQHELIGLLEDSVNSRGYKEYYVWKKYDIMHFQNFVELPDSIFDLIFLESKKNNIPTSIFIKIIDKESGFKFISNSEGSGAMGYMQLMPRTFASLAKKMNLKGGNTPMNNIRVGAFYLKLNYLFWLERLKNEYEAWRHAVAEYGVGRGGMQHINQDSTVTYRIPESSLYSVNKVMKGFQINDTIKSF